MQARVQGKAHQGFNLLQMSPNPKPYTFGPWTPSKVGLNLETKFVYKS